MPEEQWDNWGLVVTVRAAAKRQLVLANETARDSDIAESKTLVSTMRHQPKLNKTQEAQMEE